MTIHVGDCRDTLRTLPDASVDSVVTDPPYELGFMGKAWDASGIAHDVGMWREVLRVLKPGGHLLAFAGSRTYHRMACAIEDAGFEIRDQIMWLYGSGFPKSLDVSKAIDKARSEDLEPVRVVCRAVRAAMDALGLKSHHLVGHFGGCNPRLIDHWAARDTDSQPAMPTLEQWATLRGLFPALASHDDEVWRLNGRKGSAGDAWSSADILGVHGGSLPGLGGERFSAADKTIREPSESARQWQGWGTALKPAHEPIAVARKPLVGTVAANVLAHGTGALNIDGCRVEHDEECRPIAAQDVSKRSDRIIRQAIRSEATTELKENGRWPANVIHDGSDEVLAAFPIVSSGARAAGEYAGSAGSAGSASLGDYEPFSAAAIAASKGSAARFFYCSKASRADRQSGFDNPGPQLSRGTTLRDVENAELSGNNHPTVKPTDLMRWLVRLVTPPGGTVLDQFTGSGSTGRAAILEGFGFIGCELDPANVAIAHTRMAAAVRERAAELEAIRLASIQTGFDFPATEAAR